MARLIDADKLKAHYSWWEDGNREEKVLFDTIVDLQPTVDPYRHGYWKSHHTGWMCSCCGVATVFYAHMDGTYCPRCGAKMDEVET